MNNDELRALAAKRLKAQADFRHYLWIWLGVSVLLVGIWFLTSPGEYFWPIWPIGGMGVGGFFIGLDAYGRGRRVITEADIDAEVERLSKRSSGER